LRSVPSSQAGPLEAVPQAYQAGRRDLFLGMASASPSDLSAAGNRYPASYRGRNIVEKMSRRTTSHPFRYSVLILGTPSLFPIPALSRDDPRTHRQRFAHTILSACPHRPCRLTNSSTPVHWTHAYPYHYPSQEEEACDGRYHPRSGQGRHVRALGHTQSS
jgi:hypothetical protein